MTVNIVDPLPPEIFEELKKFLPRCKDCRHWEPNTHTTQPWGDCTKLSDDEPNDDAPARAYGRDAREGNFMTLSWFSCLLWEPKP